jgi:hypothetical protein
MMDFRSYHRRVSHRSSQLNHTRTNISKNSKTYVDETVQVIFCGQADDR